tara:strand:- start:22 stop:621 length:600 start_codon:yes stop_codon:yes gene_type:complete
MKLDLNIYGIILVIFILFICIKIYFESDYHNLRCIVSSVDGNQYCVRETAKLELVADKLARVTKKMKTMVYYLYKKYPNRKNCQRLKNRFNPKKIQEILPTSKYTAYSENKGEKLAFCTTVKKGGNNLIDDNTLTFVALHELSHIATESVGHTPEFWNNFKFILKNAVKIKIYKPIDYSKTPREYCSLKITDNPLYNLS